MATPNQTIIDSSTNTIDIQTNDNQLYINSEVCNTEVTVTQPITSVIQVATIGPQGPQGLQGNALPYIATGSVSASVNIGAISFQVTSGSSTLFTLNNNGGATATSFTGSLFGTASQALTASFINTSSTNAFVQDGNSFGASAILGTNDNHDLEFETNGISRLAILSTGDIVSLEKVQIQNKLEQGLNTTANGIYSHAEGNLTTATGQSSHTEGDQTTAVGNYSHAEGEGTTANGVGSHAEGYYTITNGQFSHAEGNETIAGGNYQLAIGQYNISSPAQSAFIIGNGVDSNNRSNLLFASGSQVQITGSLRINGPITDVDYIDFDTTATVTQPTQARLSWNDTDGTLDLGLKGGNVKLEIGQTEVVRVVNKTNENLLQSQYKVVRIRRSNEGGAQGQRLAVVLAQANNDPNSVDTIGLVAENIDNNQEGFIVSSGLVKNINTTQTGPYGENWMEGDVLYLSPTTAGALTNIKPQAPNHTVIVGFVVYAHQNNGKIFVKVDNGYEIDELHNVRINTASLSTGDLLVYNSSSGYWQNSKQLSGSYGLTGSLTATSFTGSFSGSIRAPGSTTQLIFNNAGVLAGTSNITYTNNLLSINTSTTIGGFTHIINDTLASQGNPQLLVGDGTSNESYYAIIPKIYTSKGAATQGQKAFASRQTIVGEDRQVQEFFIETGIIDGKPSTGTESPILTLTDQERVGIGTIDPRAKLEVLGSVLISGSSTLTNIGPAVFSGSITQQPIFTASLGYLTSTGAIINGNVTVTGTASINTLQINQTILSTGSNQLGDNVNDTQILYGSVIIPTGSLTVTGSLNVSGSITGSLFGTSSWAQNALTASFLPIGTYNITASNAINALTASFLPTGTYSITSSWAQNALTASFVNTSSTNAFVQDGNSFGATALLGTNDNQNLQFETSGSVRMTISSSGNVGIGTSTPLSTLTVAGGNINIGTGYGIGGNNVGTFAPFIRYNTNAGIVSSSFGHETAYMLSDGGGIFGANDLSFYAGAVTQPEIMRIVGSTGFVGIGESSPSAKLEIKGSGTTSATTALRVENSNASASLVVLDNGNVGIGTTSPTAILNISGSTIITGSFNVNAGTTTPHIRGAALRVSELANGAAGTLTLGSVSNIYSDLGTFSFKGGITGTTEFMFLSGSRVGIGTNNPTNTLQVVGDVTATSFTGSLFGTSSWAQNALTSSFVNTSSTNAFVQGGNSFGASAILGTNDNQNLQFETSGSVRMTISSSGNVGIGTSTPSARLEVSGSDAIINSVNIGLGGGNISSNTRVGVNALRYNTTGTTNVAIGNNALLCNQCGRANTAIGFEALCLNTTNNNTAIGYRALRNNTTGNNNTAIGLNALSNNTTGYNNTAIGLSALRNNTTGIYNTAIGFYSLSNNTTGRDNTAIGNSALRYNTTGVNNTAIGLSALRNNTTGIYNTAIGFYSLSNNTTGRDNTAIGYNALRYNTTGDNNTAIGNSALLNNTTGIYNTAIGFYSLRNNTTGNNNTAIGNSALHYSTGNNNIGLGINAGYCITTGACNVILGSATGAGFETQNNNIFIADGAGNTRIFVSGSGNVGIGTSTPRTSLHISGSSPILTLVPQNPLPTTNIPTGSFAVSASIPPRPYMWDGTSWYAL